MKVIINCAASVDGKIALPIRRQTRISSEEDMGRVHRLRASVDAVLVGVGTIISDDPKLTVKKEYAVGKNPIRVVLDTKLRTPENAMVLNDMAPTIIFNAIKYGRYGNAELVKCPENHGLIDLDCVLSELEKRGVKILMVEGGGTVIWEFLRQRQADELNVFLGDMVIGGRNSPTIADGEGAKNMEEIVKLEFIEAKRMGEGLLIRYKIIK